MERLTKAAMATGAAAVLLMGGAGTMAYWTAQETAENATGPLQSGTFTVGDANCPGGWTYANPSGGNVTTIVPGDVVQTTCEFTVTGTGDHLALGGAKVENPTWAAATAATQNLQAAMPTVVVSNVSVQNGAESETPDPTTGLFSSPLPMSVSAGTSSVTVDVTIQVTFPYNDSTPSNADAPVNNATQSGQAQLGDITVTFIQGNSVASWNS